jgi:segregation and condensation protein B
MSEESGPTEDASAEAEQAPAAEGPVEASTEASTEARRALEAIVMVADQPADAQLLAQLVELSPGVVEATLEALAAEYEEQHRGFRLVKVAGGWRFQSHEDLSPYVERFVLSGQSARLSAAALETLAIVAYKQPISRAQVAAIRGVNVDGVMRTLQQRGYIDEIGRDAGPGQATLFGTTAEFLERVGLNSLEELPSLGDFIPGADVVELLEQGLRVEPEVPLPSMPEDPDGPPVLGVDDLVDEPGDH